MSRLRVAVAYRLGKRELSASPGRSGRLAAVPSRLRAYRGWRADLSTVRRWADLPARPARYVDSISRLAGVPIRLLSVGSERDAVIRPAGGPSMPAGDRQLRIARCGRLVSAASR